MNDPRRMQQNAADGFANLPIINPGFNPATNGRPVSDGFAVFNAFNVAPPMGPGGRQISEGQAAAFVRQVSGQSGHSDMNTSLMSKSSEYQNANWPSMDTGPNGSPGADRMSRIIEKLEKLEGQLDIDARLEKFQDKLMQKMDSFEHSIGSQFTEVANRLDETRERLAEKLGNGLNEVQSSVKRSSAMLESKVEATIATKSKEQRQNALEDLKSQFDQWSEKLGGNSMAAAQKETKMAVDSNQEALDRIFKKVERLHDAQAEVLSKLGGSLNEMTDGWTQQIVQESRSNAFALQAKLGALEETHRTKQMEMEELLVSKMKQLAGDTAESVAETIRFETKSTAQKLQSSTDGCASSTRDEISRLDAKVTELLRDIKGEVSKTTETSYSAFTNSIRLQIEGIQGAITGKIDTKIDASTSQMQSQTHYIAESLNDLLGAKHKESNDLTSDMYNKLDMGQVNIRSWLADKLNDHFHKEMDMLSQLSMKLRETEESQQGMYHRLHAELTDNFEQASGTHVKFHAKQSDMYSQLESKQMEMYEKLESKQYELYQKLESKQTDMYSRLDAKLDSKQAEVCNKIESKQNDMHRHLGAQLRENMDICRSVDARLMQSTDRLLKTTEQSASSQSEGYRHIKDYVSSAAKSHQEAVLDVRARTGEVSDAVKECAYKLAALCDHCQVVHHRHHPPQPPSGPNPGGGSIRRSCSNAGSHGHSHGGHSHGAH